jgi:hypothetical protein
MVDFTVIKGLRGKEERTRDNVKAKIEDKERKS